MKAFPIACIAGSLFICAMDQSTLAEIPGVGVKLAVSTAKPKPAEGEEESDGTFPRIGYRGEVAEGVLTIHPTLTHGEKPKDYLAQLKAGGPIDPPTFGSPDYDVFFPAIDVRVVNNSKSALHISRVDLKVAESSPDPTPLPMIFGGYDELQHIVLFNEGWGKIDKAEFAFDLVSKMPKGKPAGELPFKRTLQRVTEKAVLTLHDELEKKGVSAELVAAAREYRGIQQKIEAIETATTDWDALEKNESYNSLQENVGKLSAKIFAMDEKNCGPFGKGRDESGLPLVDCWLHGWLTLSWQDDGKPRDMKLAVICPVLVVPPDGLGAVGPVMGHYEAMLQREGKDYTLQVPVSHVVKPGGIARFDVTLGVPETSHHVFSVGLTTTDGKFIDAGKVDLSGLLPRAAAASLRDDAEKPAE